MASCKELYALPIYLQFKHKGYYAADEDIHPPCNTIRSIPVEDGVSYVTSGEFPTKTLVSIM